MSKSIPLRERFWPKVDSSGGPDGCWEWQGAKCTNGYGLVYVDPARHAAYAHRIAYELVYGPMPSGVQVCRSCDNRVCVNPKHLRLKAVVNSVKDGKAKGRGRRGEPRYAFRGELNWNHKLTNRQVLDIRERYSRGDVTAAQLAREYGVSDHSMRDVIHGRTWRHLLEVSESVDSQEAA